MEIIEIHRRLAFNFSLWKIYNSAANSFWLNWLGALNWTWCGHSVLSLVLVLEEVSWDLYSCSKTFTYCFGLRCFFNRRVMVKLVLERIQLLDVQKVFILTSIHFKVFTCEIKFCWLQIHKFRRFECLAWALNWHFVPSLNESWGLTRILLNFTPPVLWRRRFRSCLAFTVIGWLVGDRIGRGVYFCTFIFWSSLKLHWRYQTSLIHFLFNFLYWRFNYVIRMWLRLLKVLYLDIRTPKFLVLNIRTSSFRTSEIP